MIKAQFWIGHNLSVVAFQQTISLSHAWCVFVKFSTQFSRSSLMLFKMLVVV